MPVVRPFRALRYSADAVDLARVVAPPYDVIDAAKQAELLARDPHNVVRLDLPRGEPGEEPDVRYRRAARTLAGWRSSGILRSESRPAFYAYEQAYRVPGNEDARTQRGFFGRLKVEPYGGGVRRHELTMPGPREDRYRLLRATGVNTSPVVMLYEEPGGAAADTLEAVAATPAAADLVDDDGVAHRLWPVTDGAALATLAAAASSGPLTVADGHHRYETALRYRDERRVGAPAGDPDPAWDYVLALVLDTAHEPLTTLPTHRVVRGLGDGWLDGAMAGLMEWLVVDDIVSREALVDAFGALRVGGGGRFGLWTRGGGLRLTAKAEAFDAALGDDAVSRLDVTRLGFVLERLLGLGLEEIAAGERVEYTHDAADAVDLVDRNVAGADAAFLLEATPVAAVLDVAAAGGVMPQKSTYFYPKALTGLVINPHEW
ncbi:MAG: DUF1015 domain-containing protein [Chloroflexi bacterium]|nr:DUF1015 domain-containing protein [Chloroflexota bacterium]